MPESTLNDLQARFRSDGYLVIERMFNERAVNAARQAIPICTGAALAKGDGQSVMNSDRIFEPGRFHPVFDMISGCEAILDVIQSLIGPSIVQQYTKLHLKPPHVGSGVDWHQEFAHYPHTNTDLLTCLLYLDDAISENGCLELLPGSHKLGLLDHHSGGFFTGVISERVVLTDYPSPFVCAAPAGSLIILHCLTLHRAALNRSSNPRRTFIAAYRSADSFPIYFGEQCARNEAIVRLVRGSSTRIARVETGNWALPGC